MKVNSTGVGWNCVTSVIAFCAVIFLCSSLAPAAAASEVSRRRINLLRSLVADFFAENPLSSSNTGITRQVMKEFSEQEDCPLAPLGPLVTAEEYKEAARKTASALVQEKYPPLDRDELEKEAAEMFPVYERGDIVTLWYRPNPGRTMRVRGAYRGRTAQAVQIGQHVILLQDIAMLAENEGEMLKFDPRASRQRREQYVQQKMKEYEAEKETYAARVRDLALQAEQRQANWQNEKNGYLLLDGKWLRLRDAVTAIIDEQRQKLQNQQDLLARRRLLEREQVIRNAIASQQLFAVAGTSMTFEDPHLLAEQHREMLAQQQVTAQEQEQEAEAQAAETEAEINEDESEEVGNEIETAAAVNDAVPDDAMPTLSFEMNDNGSWIPWWFYLVLAAVGVILIAAIAVSLSHYRPQPGKFFKGKGRLQRDFWQMAEADPEHFMYVAYRFPSEQAARQALLGLSYVTHTTGGTLKCRRPIMFGFYPHHDKFVSFVGGDKLNYALWREASALFPELPEAEYFRVSPAPEVILDIPDIQQLLADDDLHITFIEKREGTGDDYSLYYMYEAETKEGATAFLKKATVESEGVHIICKTPEGTWGKDANGIYQE